MLGRLTRAWRSAKASIRVLWYIPTLCGGRAVWTTMHRVTIRMLLRHYPEDSGAKSKLARCLRANRRTIHHQVESGSSIRTWQPEHCVARHRFVAHKEDPCKESSTCA